MRRSCQLGASAEIPYRIKTLFHNADGSKPVLPRQLELIHENPNIYFVRDFLTENEIEYFDRMCTQQGKSFKHSFTENDLQQEVISEERTSTYTYLSKGQDATIRNLEHRAAQVAGLSSDCLEPLQVVSYTAGQKFDTHHDAGTLNEEDGSVELVMPRRLATLLIYLNTLPEGQGHTEFPDLKLSVRPERGCGVLFCNVLGDGQPDPRTVHRACPVDGDLRKYAINVWMTDQSFQSLACVQKKNNKSPLVTFSADKSAFLLAEKAASLYNGDKGAGPSPSSKRSASIASPFPRAADDESHARKRAPHSKSSSSSSSSTTTSSHVSKSVKSKKIPFKRPSLDNGDETETEDEETGVLQWGNQFPAVGVKVAAPFFIWDEHTDSSGRKKRKKIERNFIGVVIQVARDKEADKYFYRVQYSDGEKEDLDENAFQESLELLEAIKRGEKEAT